tara:strand:- start:838 stop:2880 length:2043 start_codon:yes stop_codon:yes gene_type:complete
MKNPYENNVSFGHWFKKSPCRQHPSTSEHRQKIIYVICGSISAVNFLRYLLFLTILLVPLNCATPAKKDSTQDLEKTQPAETKVEGPSFISKIKSEILGDRSRITIKGTGPIQYTAFKLTDPLRLILDISDMQPKPEAEEPIHFNRGAVNTVSTHYFNETNITRIIIGLNQNAPHDITKPDDNELKIDIDLPQGMQADAEIKQELMKPQTAEEAPEMKTAAVEKPYAEPVTDEILIEESRIEEQEDVEEEPKSIEEEEIIKFTGQLISLDFQRADLVNILRLIAGVSGLNIITSPEVKGTVTLRLLEVPWDQALDIILRNNQLKMKQDGNVIRITTLKQFKIERKAEIDAEEMKQASAKMKEESVELESETVRISYATLTELLAVLDGVKSSRGDIKSDTRTKTLILHDIPDKIAEMKDLIKILDKRTQQVTIEARIVEVNTTFARELGIQWGGSLAKTTNKIFPNTVQLRGGLAGGDLGGDVTAPNFIVDLPAAAATTGAGAALGLSLGSLTGAALLDVRLSAMESSNNGKILSSPRLTTANHKAAKISSGTKIPYETVSSEGTKTEWIDAAISLDITPHITPDGFIHLEITANKDEFTASGTILEKKLNTEVLIKNGETTVLGGLYKTAKDKSFGGTPFLSKIPFLKWLFSQENKTETVEELLIFITPNIVEENQETL